MLRNEVSAWDISDACASLHLNTHAVLVLGIQTESFQLSSFQQFVTNIAYLRIGLFLLL